MEIFTFECLIEIEADNLIQAINKFHTHTDDLDWTDEILVDRIQGYEDCVVNQAYLDWHKLNDEEI